MRQRELTNRVARPVVGGHGWPLFRHSCRYPDLVLESMFGVYESTHRLNFYNLHLTGVGPRLLSSSRVTARAFLPTNGL